MVTIPIDGDVLLMYYRSDLLEEFDQPIPRTWEEYAQVAEFFDGMIYNGTRLYGSCLGRTPGCAGGYWNLGTAVSDFFCLPSKLAQCMASLSKQCVLMMFCCMCGLHTFYPY